MPKPINNTELVQQMMEFSNFGPLAQLFIIDAITKCADAVAASTLADYPNAETMVVGPESWIAVAKDIKSQMDAFYTRRAG